MQAKRIDVCDNDIVVQAGSCGVLLAGSATAASVHGNRVVIPPTVSVTAIAVADCSWVEVANNEVRAGAVGVGGSARKLPKATQVSSLSPESESDTPATAPTHVQEVVAVAVAVAVVWLRSCGVVHANTIDSIAVGIAVLGGGKLKDNRLVVSENAVAGSAHTGLFVLAQDQEDGEADADADADADGDADASQQLQQQPVELAANDLQGCSVGLRVEGRGLHQRLFVVRGNCVRRCGCAVSVYADADPLLDDFTIEDSETGLHFRESARGWVRSGMIARSAVCGVAIDDAAPAFGLSPPLTHKTPAVSYTHLTLPTKRIV